VAAAARRRLKRGLRNQRPEWRLPHDKRIFYEVD
jgi:hypothetical protein